MGTSLTIGKRVGQLRIARGMSRKQLADQVGRGTEWLKSVELGRRTLDSYSLIGALAAALDVDIADLTASPDTMSPDRTQQSSHLAVPQLRRALFRAEIGLAGDGAASPLYELRKRIDAAHKFRRHARYGELGAVLPELLTETANTASVLEGPDVGRAYGLLAEVRHDAAMWAKKLGYVDLAGMAALQSLRAARKSSNPMLVTMAVWTQAEVYMSAGAIGEAHELTSRSLAELDGQLGDGQADVWSLWGTMHLCEAVIMAQWHRRQEAATHMMEAAAAADRVGCGSDHYQTIFGPENRAIHIMHVGLELGDGIDVLHALDGVNLSRLPKERRARAGIDRARAHSQSGQDVAAMEELLEADRISPEAVRNHVMVKELTGVAVERSRVPHKVIAAMAVKVGIA